MANSNSSAASSGIGVVGLLGVAFIVLKLCHVIEWNWLWVLAPFWGPVALLVAIVAAALFGYFLYGIYLAIKAKPATTAPKDEPPLRAHE